MRTSERFHGPEIDAATKLVGGPVEMAAKHGICMTGLTSRASAHVDVQMEEFAKHSPEAVRAELAAEGTDASGFTDFDLFVLMVRSLIGGAFTFGIGTGLELAAVVAPARYSPIPEGRGADADA